MKSSVLNYYHSCRKSASRRRTINHKKYGGKEIMNKKIIAVALAALMLALAIPVNAAIQATSVEVRGTVANETAIEGGLNASNVSAGELVWTPQTFSGFYYHL